MDNTISLYIATQLMTALLSFFVPICALYWLKKLVIDP